MKNVNLHSIHEKLNSLRFQTFQTAVSAEREYQNFCQEHGIAMNSSHIFSHPAVKSLTDANNVIINQLQGRVVELQMSQDETKTGQMVLVRVKEDQPCISVPAVIYDAIVKQGKA